MKRVPEPELMDDPAQAAAYARADFAAVNAAFVERFCATFPDLTRGRVLDAGCGPADIPARLAVARSALRITATDAARAMLAEARITLGGRGTNVGLVCARVPHLPFATATFDAVISNSLLHHLADPAVFWTEAVRVAHRGAAVLVVDLLRPASPARAQVLVDTYAGDESELLRRDFYNSLRAAFTCAEIEKQLRSLGAGLRLEAVTDRHWAAWGRLNAT